jgi:diguanylate cyclase
VHAGGDAFHVTVSVGFATARPGDTLGTLVDQADRALYRAKSRGRNRVEGLPRPEHWSG